MMDERGIEMFSRAMQIATSIEGAAAALVERTLAFPPGKPKGYRVFIKKYNRRPMNRRKRDTIITEMSVISLSTLANVSRIASAPIPKYKKDL